MKVGSYIYTNSYAPADTNQLWVKPMSNGEAILYIFVDGKWTPTGGVGESAYEAAVKAGFNGSKEEWLDSLTLKYSDLTAEQKADLVKDAVSAAERAAQAVENIENTINDIDVSSTDGAITALAAKQGLLENELTALGPELSKIKLGTIHNVIKFSFEEGKYIGTDGAVHTTSNTNLCADETYYPIFAGVECKLLCYAPGSIDVIAIYDINKTKTSTFTSFASVKTFTPEANGYIRVSNEKNHIGNADCYLQILVNSDYKTLKELIPYYTAFDQAVVEHNHYCSNSSQLIATLLELVADTSATKPSETHRHIINLGVGEYDVNMVTAGEEDIELTVPPYTKIVGKGIGKTKLVYKYTGSDTNIINMASGLNCPYCGTVLEDFTIEVQNIRYAIHSDSASSLTNVTKGVIQCNRVHFIHLGGGKEIAWGSGIRGKVARYFNGCVFEAKNYSPFFLHNALADDTNKGVSYVAFDNCEFINHTYNNLFTAPYTDSDIVLATYDTAYNAQTKVVFNNCKIRRGIYVGRQGTVTVTEPPFLVETNTNDIVLTTIDAEVPYYKTSAIKQAYVHTAITKGQPIMYVASVNRIMPWDGSSRIDGIAIFDFATNDVGYYAGVGAKIPANHALGINDANTGDYYSYVGGTWEKNDSNPILYCEQKGVLTVLDVNADNRIFKNAQASIVKNSIEINNTIDIQYNIDNIQQGLLLASNGSVGQTTGDHPNYKYCPDYFPVIPNGKIKVTAICLGSYAGVVFYDASFAFVSSHHPSANSIVDVPSSARYVRICSEQYSTSGLALTSLGTNTDDTPKYGSRNLVTSGAIFAMLQEIQKSKRVDFVFTTLTQGLVNIATGRIFGDTGDYPNRRYTNFVPVIPGSTIYTNAYGVGSTARVAFYTSDNENDYISGVNGSSDTTPITVPSTAAFARFSTERYNTTGLTAYKAKEVDSDVVELKSKVDELEGIVGVNGEYDKPYFNTNQDDWIADEESKTFAPRYPKIVHKYEGEVTPEKRFIALGFDDFRATDFSLIIPLLDKYGARAEFNRVHNYATIDSEDTARINSIINGRHEIGDHTWKHYKFPFDEPLFNGQDPSSPDGEQVPFPSNDQLREDAGDGKNVFGRTLTNNVKTDLGYQAPNIDTTWASMTDEQCQEFRNYFSVMKDTNTNLITLLDTLSNSYLGTTGSSNGSWDDNEECYTGGIFTGCKTSQNHEIWERILLVTNMFLKDKFGLNYNLITWSLPGSKNSLCRFPYNGVNYFDSAHTKRYGNLARFASSLYKNNDGTAKERSWTDVLREFGYKTTHDATCPSNLYCKKYQFIMNARQSRIDALSNPTNRLMSYSKIASEYTKGTDLTGTEPYEVQMYDGGAEQGSTQTSFRNEIEQWRHSTANGIIWGAVIDSQDTWSERMILEGLLKYGTKTGIEFITHAEAYDICFNHTIKSGNLVYNPRLRNTAKEFMPSSQTVPSNPDGYVGSCSVSMADGTPVLTTTGNTVYQHYGIPYGKIKYSADVKGSGSITIKAIKNNTPADSVSSSSTLITTISVDNNDFDNESAEFVVADNGISAYEDQFEGVGDKIIGLYIIYSSGLQVKNICIKMNE